MAQKAMKAMKAQKPKKEKEKEKEMDPTLKEYLALKSLLKPKANWAVSDVVKAKEYLEEEQEAMDKAKAGATPEVEWLLESPRRWRLRHVLALAGKWGGRWDAEAVK